ncbi:MAG: SusD/RagB family nutrient-binding outer membrane lipoprotein, partial [Runella slithyformis]
MKIRNKLKIVLFLSLSIVVSSCSLDLVENPNEPAIKDLNINFLLNRIETDYAGHFNQMSDPAMRLTRMLNQGAAIYDNAVTPNGLNGAWTNAYANIMNDVKTLIPLAETGGLLVHAGIARTIRASVLLNLVDAFGDVPYSEALNIENFNPKTDGGATIYAGALADLDKAIENFTATSRVGAPGDLIFGGTADSWVRVANTLKLKALLNRSLIDKAGATTAINTLIAGNRLVSTAGQNFTFRYGVNLLNPDTRHPRYGAQYSPTGGGDYQSNSYMGAMFGSKGFPDPRIRYYFYRQRIRNSTSVNEIRCITNQKPAHYGA